MRINNQVADVADMSSLAFLKEAAARSCQQTDEMVDIVASFNQRLVTIETTILPVYNETKMLQQKQLSTVALAEINFDFTLLSYIYNMYG